MTYEEKYKILLDLMLELCEYYKDDNWLFIKKYMVRYANPEARKLLSTRHFHTKKHTLNENEVRLINDYKKNANIELKLYEKDKHKEGK